MPDDECGGDDYGRGARFAEFRGAEFVGEQSLRSLEMMVHRQCDEREAKVMIYQAAHPPRRSAPPGQKVNPMRSGVDSDAAGGRCRKRR